MLKQSAIAIAALQMLAMRQGSEPEVRADPTPPKRNPFQMTPEQSAKQREIAEWNAEVERKRQQRLAQRKQCGKEQSNG